jgi:nucleoside-triphosphatase THEP1
MQQQGRIILLSGGSELGKTTFCLKLVDMLEAIPMVVYGVICPPVYEGLTKTGIDIQILKSGAKHHLAQLNSGKSEGLFTRKWQFDETVIEWGNQELAKATPCDILIVDELGPLEFERGLGFLNGFTVINSRDYKAALVVIRPSLLPNAIKRWPDANIVSINTETRETLLDQVFALLTQ